MYKDQFGVLRYTHEEILDFIKRFQNEGTIKTFTEGCCYWFAKILNDRFNFGDLDEGLMYNEIDNHFCTLIITSTGYRYYDITGEIKIEPGRWVSWDDFVNAGDELLVERIFRDCIDF